MRKSFKNIIVLLFAAFAVAFQMFPMESRAEGEEVYFGSESYSWTIYEESPVGIYVESSEGISEVDMIVTYEPDMIEYSSGGTLAEEGSIEINASVGGVTQYQTMLNFIPQAGGSSEITIESASITTSDGNTYELDPVTVTESVTVPDMCQLEDIQINGESLPDFNSRQTEYSIEVGADVTEADVTVAPSDADVQISDTSLEVGENVITVVSTDLWDHDARYRIRITRAEPETVAQTEPETVAQTEPETTAQTEMPVIQESSSGSVMHILIPVLIVILVVILAALVVLKVMIVRRNRKKQHRRQRNHAKRPVQFDEVVEDDVQTSERLNQNSNRRKKVQHGSQGQQRVRKITDQVSEEREMSDFIFEDFKLEDDLPKTEDTKQAEEIHLESKDLIIPVPVDAVAEEKTEEKAKQQPKAKAAEEKVQKGKEKTESKQKAETEQKPAVQPVKEVKKTEVDVEKKVAKEKIVPKTAATKVDSEDKNEAPIEIDVKHVTMEFKREKDEATSIKELMVRTIRGQRSYEMFKALDDVSFTIHKGEVVGIIGTNGSGKSTILKIISGVLKPTKGSVEVDKSKIQLLTLGTGFDYELTGRENVYLNGAIIGYTKEFIDEHYDEIVKFAELEGFMEEKVRNYSSGMVSRLGFAIATIRDTPEILILDEVLSVGDMFFRKKSEKRIKEMMHGGSTVLIVSHSTSVIRSNCTKAVWIEKGKLRAVGDPKEVCAAYEKMNA